MKPKYHFESSILLLINLTVAAYAIIFRFCPTDSFVIVSAVYWVFVAALTPLYIVKCDVFDDKLLFRKPLLRVRKEFSFDDIDFVKISTKKKYGTVAFKLKRKIYITGSVGFGFQTFNPEELILFFEKKSVPVEVV